ncbi:MAG TPA: DUF2892 domain-containing protein [Opitutaceae bacterium]
MKTESIVRLMVGTLVLTSLALYHWHNPNWIWLTVFVGFNLIQSSFTGFCPTEIVVRKLRGETSTGAKIPSRA